MDPDTRTCIAYIAGTVEEKKITLHDYDESLDFYHGLGED